MKITAVCAGVGVAVGAALFGVLHWVVDPAVLHGLAAGGTPQRYVDYRPVGGAWSLRLLPVALGSGLVAGLLAGVLLRVPVLRRASGGGRTSRTVALVAVGLLVGCLLSVELYAYARHAAVDDDFGWYAYSPLTNISVGPDGVLYGGGTGPSWWLMLITGVVVGLVVGAAAAGAGLLVHRIRRA